jgi:hypothetical protein
MGANRGFIVTAGWVGLPCGVCVHNLVACLEGQTGYMRLASATRCSGTSLKFCL